MGLERIVVRELVNNPDKTNEILGSTFILKLCGGILALVLSVSAIYLVRPRDSTIGIMIIILASGFLFQSLDTIDFWFQSQVLSKYTVFAKNSAFIIIAGLKLALILLKAPLIFFAIAITVEVFIGAVCLILAYNLTGLRIQNWSGNVNIAKKIFKDSWPLIISGAAIIIYMKIDQVMLGEMLGGSYVGEYSVAVRISEVWYFIPTIIASSVFPSILSAKKESLNLYTSKLQQLYDLMSFSSIAIAVVITIFSDEIILTFFGSPYQKAGPVLSIHVWAGISVFLGIASTQYLIAENLIKIQFFRTITGCIANIILNLYFIPRMGITGAAWATLISYSLATFSIIFIGKTKKQGAMLIKSFLFLEFSQNIRKHLR